MTMENVQLDAVARDGGLLYLTGDKRIALGIPHDGEWIFATGEDLGQMLETIARVDGAPYEGEGITVRPYLLKEEVADEIREMIKQSFEDHGHFAKVVDADDLIVPPAAPGQSPF